jgi:hypothetical protein
VRVLSASRAPIALACIASCALLALAIVPRPQATSGLGELAAFASTLAQRMQLQAAHAQLDAVFTALELKIAMGLADPPHGCPSLRERSRAMERLRDLQRQQALLQRRIEQQRRKRAIEISAACIDNPLGKDCI